MKKLILGVLFLGFTTLVFSQTEENIKLEDVTVSSAVNLHYINSVTDDTTPMNVRALEELAANFDIKKLSIYDPTDKEMEYEVSFKNSQGSILAYYDYKGIMKRASEIYKNISLPVSIRNSVYKAYPHWTIKKNQFFVSYKKGAQAEKLYRVILKDDKSRKVMKLEAGANGSLVAYQD